MKWVELSVDTPPEFVEPLSHVFYRHGQGGVAVEEPGGFSPDEGESQSPPDLVTVKTYVPLDERLNERRGQIDLGVRLIAHLAPVSELRQRILEESEWENAWKEHFHVLHVGTRTVVVPTWRDYKRKEGDVVIELDPGMAFGTGHHPTTRMCLEYLERLVDKDIDVLDVGCGSAILSIAAAKLGARQVVGLEIEEVAVRVANDNIERNRCQDIARIESGTLPHSAVASGVFGLVVANISAKVVVDLADELVGACRPGAKMLLSGVLEEREEEVVARLTESGAQLESRQVDSDWTCFVMRAQ